MKKSVTSKPTMRTESEGAPSLRPSQVNQNEKVSGIQEIEEPAPQLFDNVQWTSSGDRQVFDHAEWFSEEEEEKEFENDPAWDYVTPKSNNKSGDVVFKVMDYFTKQMKRMDKDVLRNVVHLEETIYFIYNLRRANSWTEFFYDVSHFCFKYFVGIHVQSGQFLPFLNEVTKLFDMTENPVTLLRAVFQEKVGSALQFGTDQFQAITKIFRMLAILPCLKTLGWTFDLSGFDKTTSKFLKESDIDSWPGLATAFVDTIFDFLEYGWQYFFMKEENLTIITKRSVTNWFLSSKTLLLETLEIKSSKISAASNRDLMNRLKKAIIYGNRLLTTGKTHNIGAMPISHLIKSMEDKINQYIYDLNNSGTRPLPYGILFEGGTGVGKTTSFGATIELYAHQTGHDPDPRYIWQVNANDPWASGLNHSQWCYVMDEFNALSNKGGEIQPSLMMFLDMHNTTRIASKQAALDDKGTKPYNQGLTVLSSNNPTRDLGAVFNEPAAVMRRLNLIVHVETKPEYANPDGSINGEKFMKRNNPKDYDKPNKFSLREYRPTRNPDLVPMSQERSIELFGLDDYDEPFQTQDLEWDNFVDLFLISVKKHQIINANVARLEKERKASSFCEHNRHSVDCVRCNAKVQALNIPHLETNPMPPRLSYSFDSIRLHFYWLKIEFLLMFRELRKNQYIPVIFFGLISFLSPATTYNVDPVFSQAPLGMQVLRVTLLPLIFTYLKMSQIFSQVFSVFIIIAHAMKYSVIPNRVRVWPRNFAMRAMVSPWLPQRLKNTLFRLAVDRIVNEEDFATIFARMYHQSILNNRYVKLLTLDELMLGGGICLSFYYMCKWLFVVTSDKEQVTVESRVVPLPSPFKVPIVEVEKVKFNYQQAYHVPLDKSFLSIASKTIDNSKLVEYCQDNIYNCQIIKINYTAEGKLIQRSTTTNCFFISGTLMLVNYHTTALDDYYDRTEKFFEGESKISKQCQFILSKKPSLEEPTLAQQDSMFTVTNSRMYKVPEKDIVVVDTAGFMRPHKDLTKFLIQKDADFRGAGYLITMDSGKLAVRDTLIAPSDNESEYVSTISQNGACSGPYVAKDYGVIVGFHYAGGSYGRDERGFLFSFTIKDYKEARLHFATLDVVQGSSMLEWDLIPLLPLHRRSRLRDNPGIGKVIGSLDKQPTSCRPAMKETFLRREVEEYFNVFHLPPLSEKTNKRVENFDWAKDPYRKSATELLKPKTPHFNDSYLLDVCANSYLQRFDEIKVAFEVLTLEESINGVEGVHAYKRPDMTTSMGFPFYKPKKEILVELEENQLYCFPPEAQDLYDKILASYKKGETVSPLFSGRLKMNEVLSAEKSKSGKCRMFFGSPFVWGCLVRRYFLWFQRFSFDHTMVTECAAGANAYGIEWTLYREHLTKYGNRIIAGDYKKFDKELPAPLVLKAFEVIITLARHNGATLEDCVIMWSIANDVAFPICEIASDIFCVFGSNPSGQPLTTIINSIANSLMMRYIWYANKSNYLEFNEHVSALFLGDDNIMGVSKKAKHFNFNYVASKFAQFGITYTNTDKVEREDPDFIQIEEAVFLQRSFRRLDIGLVLAPLNPNSIAKSFAWTRSDDDMSAHIRDRLYENLIESSLHGSRIYNHFHKFVVYVAAKYNYDSIFRFKLENMDHKAALTQLLSRHFLKEDIDVGEIPSFRGSRAPLVWGFYEPLPTLQNEL